MCHHTKTICCGIFWIHKSCQFQQEILCIYTNCSFLGVKIATCNLNGKAGIIQQFWICCVLSVNLNVKMIFMFLWTSCNLRRDSKKKKDYSSHRERNYVNWKYSRITGTQGKKCSLLLCISNIQCYLKSMGINNALRNLELKSSPFVIYCGGNNSSNRGWHSF